MTARTREEIRTLVIDTLGRNAAYEEREPAAAVLSSPLAWTADGAFS